MTLLFVLVGGFCARSSGGCLAFGLACHRDGNHTGFLRCLACSLVAAACAGVNAVSILMRAS